MTPRQHSCLLPMSPVWVSPQEKDRIRNTPIAMQSQPPQTYLFPPLLHYMHPTELSTYFVFLSKFIHTACCRNLTAKESKSTYLYCLLLNTHIREGTKDHLLNIFSCNKMDSFCEGSHNFKVLISYIK